MEIVILFCSQSLMECRCDAIKLQHSGDSSFRFDQDS